MRISHWASSEISSSMARRRSGGMSSDRLESSEAAVEMDVSGVRRSWDTARRRFARISSSRAR